MKQITNDIEIPILNRKFQEKEILLPGTTIPRDMPVEFERLQFPMQLAFT